MGLFDRFKQADEPPPASAPLPPAPTHGDIDEALRRVEQLVADPGVPAAVRSRTLRVTATIRQTLPRLENLGLDSYDAYSVVATATDYLPQAIGAYLRLPRDWADTRPVDGGKTSLLVLVDQLDLLASIMDKIADAANRTDAGALVAHGRFLQQKFGHAPDVPDLTLGAP